MTVVVWDGETLATDCAATDGVAKWESTKAWEGYCADYGDVIISGAGPLQTILRMRDWILGSNPHRVFPKQQEGPQFCYFLVVTKHQGLLRWEQGPIPIEHGYSKCAFGEGKDFAYGALAMGATAEEAVKIANEYSVHCGLGVKTYHLGVN